MSFGSYTVTVVSFTDSGQVGPLGTSKRTETVTPVRGCHHRPLRFDETPEWATNIATEVWKTTAPPVPAILGLKANDVIRVEGLAYKVIAGPQHHRDLNGPFKVTILTERTTG